MKLLRFLFVGVLFGIVMTKSEVISWFRIQEMFRFQSFHMYGVIGVAVVLGIIIHLIIKRGVKNADGTPIKLKAKPNTYKASILGGTVFGAGWAMTGACPGPLYILVGNGYWVVLVIIASALLGTLTYGLLRPRLPH